MGRGIIVSGAQCTGKSTLIKALKEKFPEISYQKEFVRKTLKKEDVNFADVEKQNKILDFQRSFIEDNDFSISDRGPLDSLSYTAVLKEEGLSNFTEEEFKDLEKRSLDILKSDEVAAIWFLGNEIPLVDDGYRTVDPKQRDAVEKKMLYYINIDPIIKNKTQIIKGNVKKRVHTCEEILQYAFGF